MTSPEGKADPVASGPIYFLIQEQARSRVAIQALRSRMAVLEGLQERLMQAIDDVHQHMSPPDAKSRQASGRQVASRKKLRFAAADERGSTSKSETSKSDSLNKDSGIGASDSSLAHNSEEEDELLQLLDFIHHRSSLLVMQAEGAAAAETSSKPPRSETSSFESAGTSREPSSSTGVLDSLLHEKVGMQREMSVIRAERDRLKQQMAKLELATKAVSKQTHKVQRQLADTLHENRSLQDRIRATCSGSQSSTKKEQSGYLADIEKANVRRVYLDLSEKSKKKVSSILKETSVLELQKQLLTYVMENDVLRAKLQQDESARMASWLKIESQLRKEIREVKEDRKKLHEVFQAKNLEIASLKDRIRALENDDENQDSNCKNFGMDSTDDWRAPGVQNVYQKRSNLNDKCPFTPLGFGDFSKTQSLPVMQLSKAVQEHIEQNTPQLNCNAYDTSSFTDVPLRNQSIHSGQHSSHKSAAQQDLVDLSAPHSSSVSTLVQSHQPSSQPNSGLSAPNLNANMDRDVFRNWGFAPRKTKTMSMDTKSNIGGAKLPGGHLCWKDSRRLPQSSELREMSSICSEFDPLSDGNPSCENYEDSLNLSIPLKPAQVPISQLSSIGDSLHSASLDLCCASTPALNRSAKRVQIARSVDGIKDLLLDTKSSKKLPTVQYGLPGSAHNKHLPMDILKYMRDSADYALL